MNRWLLATGAVLPATMAGLGLGFKPHGLWIPYWPLPPRTIYDCSSSAFSGPRNPTTEELEAFNRAVTCHDPVPAGFTLSGHARRVLARTTGSVDWLGRHEIQVSVTDGSGRLASARLYLGNELVSEASLEDGRIVDHGDEDEGTLDFFLPWLPHFTVTLITNDQDGQLEEESLTIGSLALESK